MKPTVCLNMIVKNEAHVIARCLASVRLLIDRWLIVDTGSTDGTQELIRKFMAGIPGELVERPWKDFGHNRSEAIALARERAEYLFIIDADEVLEAPAGFQWPALTGDAYALRHGHGSIEYWRPSLIATRLPWRYVGVLHEYLESGTGAEHRAAPIEGPRVLGHYDGGRSRIGAREKYARDAQVLEAALKADPDNARYAFYLAQSYRDSDQPEKAIEVYRRRAQMGGFAEEVWYALYEIALLSEKLSMAPALIVDRYLDAYDKRPTRAEPLVQLARYCRERERWGNAQLFAERAMAIAKPADILFIDAACYDWRGQDEYSIACYWLGDYAESARAAEQLLASGKLPADQRERVMKNLDFAREKLGRR